jgi:hypothetical protein
MCTLLNFGRYRNSPLKAALMECICRNMGRLRPLTFVALCSVATMPHSQTFPYADVTGGLTVKSSGLVLNRASNTFDATMTVTSPLLPLSAPMALVIDNISSSAITVSNATARTATGGFVVPLPTFAGSFGFDSAPLTVTVKFANPQRVTFTFAAHVMATIDAYTLYPNPLDDRLIDIVTPQGFLASVYARKDASGNVLSISSIVATDGGGAPIFDFFTDDQSRVSVIEGPTGERITISYDANGPSILTITDSSGQFTASAPFGVQSAKVGRRVAAMQQEGTRAPSVSGFLQNGIATVNVTSCGMPRDDASVGLSLRNVTGVPLFSESQLGGLDGAYNFSIPVSPPQFPPVVFANTCKTITGDYGLGGACTLLNGTTFSDWQFICAAVGAGITAIGGILVAPETVAVCEASYPLLDTYCKTVGAAPGDTEGSAPNGASSIAEQICENVDQVVESIQESPNAILTADAQIPGVGVGLASASANSNGPFTPLAIDITPKAGCALLTQVSLSSSIEPSAVNQSVMLMAQVSVAANQVVPPGTVPTGLITVSDGGAVICSASIASSGLGSCSVSFSNAGTHNIDVQYAGDSNFAPSSSSVVQLVSDLVFSGPFAADGTYDCVDSNTTSTVTWSGTLYMYVFRTNVFPVLTGGGRVFSGCFNQDQLFTWQFATLTRDGNQFTAQQDFPADSWTWNATMSQDMQSVSGTFFNMQHHDLGNTVNTGTETGAINLQRITYQ